jgi:hypothetical protein
MMEESAVEKKVEEEEEGHHVVGFRDWAWGFGTRDNTARNMMREQ